jgi:hypothetical protein
MKNKLLFTRNLALVALLLLMLMPGKGWGQVNNTSPVLLDNYDGVGDLTYTANAASQWSITGGIYVAGTNASSSPEHSCASYDLTNSISGWNLVKTNQNVWNGYFKILRTTSGWGTANYGCGSVIACNLADFSSTSAQGYALVIENGTPDKVTLVKFSQGIKDGAANLPLNATAIVSVGVDPGTTGFNYLVELLSDGKWKLSYITGTQLSDANAIIKTSYSGGNATSASADETYTGNSYKYSGWVFSHSSGNTATDKANFDNFGAAQGSTNSSSSDIITNPSFTYPINIPYGSYQGTTPLTDANSIEVAQFDIRDGGGTADADVLATTLTALTLNVANPASIRRIALFDGSTNVGEVAGGATAAFSSLTLAAADNASKTFSVRVSFLSSVTDNQQFSFTVNSATASGSGSAFAAANAGGAVTSTSSDNNRIEVTASDIIFDQAVSTVSLGAVMSPSPTLKAIDANVNYDLDYATTWSVAVTTGTATFDGTATTSGTFASGVVTLSNLKFNSAGTSNQITVTSGSFDDISGSFDVTNPQPEINVKENVTNYLTGSTYGFGNHLSGSSSSVITFTIENLGTATLNLSGSPIVDKSGANAAEFTVDQTATTATVASNGNTTFTVTFSPTSQGSKSAQLSIANNDATGSENPYLINLTGTSTVSSASDIATTGGYSYTSNVAYENYQTASTLTTGNTLGVNGLTIRDGGATTDADNLGTTLTAISFTTGGSTAIRTAALFDGSTNVGEVAVNGATTIAFSGLSLTAADGGTKDFELRVTYQASVTDNQQITFTVSSATASTAGSGFAVANAGAAASTATGDINRIEVTATALVFGVNPGNVTINAVMSPSPTVVALDGLANFDLDFTGSVTLTSTGTISGSATNPVSAIGGTATFSNLKFSAFGTGITIAGTSGSLTATGNSSTFNVTVQAAGILLSEDNFTATSGALTSNGWTQIGSTATNPINTGSGNGLSFTNYGSSNIGNSAIMGSAGGQDLYRTFTSQNPGAGSATAYYSCMVNFTSIATGGDYFICLGEASTMGGSATFRARLYAKRGSTASKVLFGISTNGTVSYGVTEYNTGATILLVVKHVFTTTTSTSSLFINPSVTSEPVAADLSENTASTVATGLDAVVLRQGGSSSSPGLIIDGVRVGTNWGAVLGNPQYDAASEIATGNYNDVDVLSNTLSLTGDVAINGTTTNNGTIAIGAHTLSINGALSGTGTYTGGATSNIAVGGTGSNLSFPAITNGLNNLSITRSNGITMGATSSLTVAGTLTNTAGNAGLVIESGGSIITNGAVSGLATIKRDVPNNFTWHFISSPVSGQNICDGTFAPLAGNFNSTNGATYDFYKWSEPVVAGDLNWINLKAGDWSLNTGDFGATPQFDVAKGYLVSYNSENGLSKSFAGTLNTGDKNVALTTGGNTWNLIGNPFASAINWDNIVTSGILADGYYYVYNENKSGGAGFESYMDDTHKTTGANGKISVAQGFFVTASSTPLVLLNSARTHNNNWMKGSETLPVNQLKLTMGNITNWDEAFVQFEGNGVVGKDFYDADKMLSMNSAIPQVYTIIEDNRKIAINSMPFNNEAFSIPVGTVVPSDGEYTLVLSGIESFTSTPSILLEDKKIAKTQNISENPVYTFTASKSDDASRFVLHFGSAFGINETGLEQPITIYATDNTVNIANTSATSVKGEVYVYNTLGQVIAHQNLSGDLTKINIAATGYYLVKVVTKSTIFTGKVFVNQQ